MGEQESFASSNPVFIVIMRNSRGKLFVFVGVLGVLCFIVFLLSSTHASLKEIEGINEKCQQQRDSLSAQLQVVYEHKNRLEKSLQQEKTDHRHSKEVNEKQNRELETKLQEEKDKVQKLEVQITQLKTSYSELEEEKTQSENALKEQLRTVQGQKNVEIEKLQTHIGELLTEKDKLEMSNNAFAWKLEQHASEINLCHLQHQQTKTELATCQEQLQKHNQNTVDAQIVSKISTNINKTPGENLGKFKSEKLPQATKKEYLAEEAKLISNKTVLPFLNEKPPVLVKPNVLPANNAADGVLPKPLDDKVEDSNKDIDAAVELSEIKNKLTNKHISNRIDERDVESKFEAVVGEKKTSKIDTIPKVDNILPREQENHPQVLPPNNFDNIGEKDDHAAERGEYGVQYGMPDVKHQLEVPAFNGKHNGRWKNFIPVPQHGNNNNNNNDIAAAQMQDMMNKSPGDVNNGGEANALHIPPQDFGPIENKIREFKHADAFLHRGADVHNVMDDKNYEEDDDDRENDDEPPNGVAQGMKGINVLQDNDFDDQENPDNADNAKEEEGVVVAPK